MQKANKPWSKQAMEPLRNNWVTLASMIFLPNGGRATQSVNNNLHLRRYLNIVARQQQDNKSNQLDAGLSRATGQQDKGTTGQLNNWTTEQLDTMPLTVAVWGSLLVYLPGNTQLLPQVTRITNHGAICRHQSAPLPFIPSFHAQGRPLNQGKQHEEQQEHGISHQTAEISSCLNNSIMQNFAESKHLVNLLE